MVTIDKATFSLLPNEHTKTAYIDAYIDITFTEDDPRPENDAQVYMLIITIMEEDSPDPDDFISDEAWHIPYPESVPSSIHFVKNFRKFFYSLDRDGWPRGDDEIYLNVEVTRAGRVIAQANTEVISYEFKRE